MTSKEIQMIAPTDLSTNSWLKAIALQLSILIEAVSAERSSAPVQFEPTNPVEPLIRVKRKYVRRKGRE